ncbi:MAG: glycoside hydrolase family 9 protein, partial [Deltaproteobacteria bacterium]
MLSRRKLITIFILFVTLVLSVAYFSSDANNDKKSQTEIKTQEKPKVIHIGPVSSDIIAVTITEGQVEYGKQIPYVPERRDVLLQEKNNLWLARKGKSIGSIVGHTEKFIMTFDQLVGERLDKALLEKPESFSISSSDDPDLSVERQPYAVFRKTKPTDFARIGATLEAPLEHTIYLKLLKPMKAGKYYTIDFKQLGIPKQTFVYEPSKMRSEAVHVSQIGFRPDDPAKVAFLSLWMGSGGAADFKEKTIFYILDDKSGDAVFKGEVKISKKTTERDEDAYGNNFNGANIYMMDFSQLQKPGKYRVYVDGIGCSYPFDIADSVWANAFYVSARGLYHQRSGIEIGPPFTTFKRPRNFHPDDGVRIYATKTTFSDLEYDLRQNEERFSKLVRGKTTEIVPDAWGGYCDAGDWDRRIPHLIAARYLFELYDYSPKYFDKFVLNIPGSKDEFPDILREALWGVDFYRRLQTKEGGIRGGIESEDHPRYGEASWQDSLAVMAFAPDVYSSYAYAGFAANAAYVLKKYNLKMSDVYSESAIRAMEWAEKELKQSKTKYHYQVNDERNLAAAELFRLTGMKSWHDIFMETTVFKGKETLLYKNDSHDQGDAAWVYYNTDKKGVDKNIKQKCKSAIIDEAERLIEAQRKTGFKWAQNPWRPAF